MTRPERLPDETMDRWLTGHAAWIRDGSTVKRSFEFGDFSEAFAFMTRVALVAEKLDHHPEWSNVYNRVEVMITTHSAGGLTELDQKFVAAIDRIIG